MLRCLIYKVHTALSGGSLFYHLVSPLSSTFFKFFKTFFSAFPRGNRLAHSPAALADDLFILPPLPRFVKHFFQIFFDLFSRSTRFRREFSAALADSLRRIPHTIPLVKHFFPFFRVFSFRVIFPLFRTLRPTSLHSPASPPNAELSRTCGILYIIIYVAGRDFPSSALFLSLPPLTLSPAFVII